MRLQLGTRRYARVEGRVDARSGVPGHAWKHSRSPAEWGLDALAAVAQAQIGAEHLHRITKLQAACEVANRTLRYAIARGGESAVKAEAAEIALREIEQQFSLRAPMNPQANPSHRRLLPRSLYLTLAVALALVELPLNSSAFDVLGLPRSETLLLAGGIGMMLVTLAHFVGVIAARLALFTPRVRRIAECTVGIVLLVVLIAGVLLLGQLRADYVTDIQHELGLAISLSRGSLSAFSLIQLGIVLAAVAASFLAHNESDDEVERAARAHRRALRRRRLAERRQLAAEKALAKPLAARDLAVAQAREKAFGSAAWFDYLRFVYRTANLRHHIDGVNPDLANAPMPPIPLGRWVERSPDLYDDLVSQVAKTEPVAVAAMRVASNGKEHR